MKSVIKDSFSINLSVMKALRIYAPENHTRFFKVQSYIIYFLFVILIPSLATLNFLIGENLNKSQVNMNAAFVSQTAWFITKLLPFINNGDRIKRCIHYFEAEDFATQTFEQKRIIEDCIRICRRNSMVFVSGVTVGMIVWNIKPLLLEGYLLPLEIWLPFDATTGPLLFYSVYLFVALGMTCAVFAGTTIDPLIGGLACHAASQVKVLKARLQNLDESTQKDENTRFMIIFENIKKCVDHHNGILKFVKEYEDCFSLVVFSQFASSAFTICFCTLQLTQVQPASLDGFVAITGILVVLAQVYFYCYYGTMLLDENNSLAEAIYMSEWYEFDLKSRRALITLMERSKRPVIVTAGKILELSLDTFTVLLRRSYSLLAVLKSFQ